MIVPLLSVVGLGDVFQQIPRYVIGDPPSAVMVPPLTADVCVIEVISEVVKTASVAALVVKLTSLPYAVPAEFIA